MSYEMKTADTDLSNAHRDTFTFSPVKTETEIVYWTVEGNNTQTENDDN